MAVSILDQNGNSQELDLTSAIYQEAADKQCSVSQLLSHKYPTNEAKYGSTFSQVQAAAGMFMQGDAGAGITKAPIGQILDGGLSAGVVTREGTPVSRLIFPATVFDILESKLKTDTTGDVAIFNNNLVAVSETTQGSRYEQPILNFGKPEGARSTPTAQLALPSSMMTLNVSDVSRSIPSFSLGLTISQEALRATTLDFVSLSLARQAEYERGALMDGWINAMVAGDTDMGLTALSTVKASSFDSTIVAAGALTHKAWVSWMRSNRRVRTIDWIICDTATYLSIVTRSGRPTVQNADDVSNSLMTIITDPANPGLSNPKVFLVETGVVPANTIVGLDSRYAIRKITNLQAEYSAAQELVMRRGTELRFDFGEVATRMYDNAFDVLQLIP
jgi:hypothetical protein